MERQTKERNRAWMLHYANLNDTTRWKMLMVVVKMMVTVEVLMMTSSLDEVVWE